MVSSDYMTKKPAPPGAAKLMLDQKLLPAAIDLAGSAERVLEWVAGFARERSILALGLAAGAGLLLGMGPRNWGPRNWGPRNWGPRNWGPRNLSRARVKWGYNGRKPR